MIRQIIILLSCISALAWAKFPNPNIKEKDVEALRNKIDNLIEDNVENGFKIMIPGIIRLGFHGCVGVCDGCINKDHPGNRGLDKIVDILEPLMEEWPGSRADMWAIAADVAMFEGRDLHNARCKAKHPDTKSAEYIKCFTKPWKKINTMVGRKDCEDGPYYDVDTNLPDMNFDSNELSEWFWEEFRKTNTDLVSLMGAHSVGKVNTKGIDRAWDPTNQDGLGRNYFQNLIELKDWTLKSNDDKTQYFWEAANGTAFALPVDISLVKDFDRSGAVYDSETGQVDKEFKDLKKAKGDLFGMTRRYAENKNNWSNTFRRHMRDVLSNGYRLYKPSKK